MAKSKYYTVWKGRKPGIYTSWADCEKQIKGYSGAAFKSFPTRQEAEVAFKGDTSKRAGVKQKDSFSTSKKKSTNSTYISKSISVDAACSGNPGVMEYQGVDTETGKLIFHEGPFQEGTNNIGEFLAIVHALAMLKEKGDETTPVYSDSATALAWVRKKKCNTTLVQNATTKRLWDLIQRAETWLRTETYHTSLLKWETKQWGEVKADFGRK
ncbi:viroplasmin family protein [Aureibacillus halotolerans]|uniref:Ribonuclease H n=1 Tax=Aureibacillus halotolerans TaxID=1508390 RepID=A0A4V3D662_9BACI|nr:ribonuclease H family protein [Aureibacillus halotolerans]TDQ42757.1 ribonuclease HI [Aureibacillus halotolerans]